MDNSDQEKYSCIIAQIFDSISLGKWIDHALEHEFKIKKGDNGSVLRGSSIISKLLTFYCRKKEKGYIKKNITDIVMLIINSENIFEVDTK